MTGPVDRLCPVCASASTALFLTRESVPAHQNLLMPDEPSALAIARGDLRLTACSECGFVFNAAFDGEKLSYGEEYENTQSYSPTFNAYLDDLVSYLVREKGVSGSRIVEVGCGKGIFLQKLIEFPGADNRGVGFDPSYIGPGERLDGRLRFDRRFYGPECANVPADVVVCRHVIEHVPDPVALMRLVRGALVNSADARVFFETPCVEWILRNRVIWDFFYEHCSYFTAQSLTTAFERGGFRVEDVRHIFGGQYLWLEARLGAEARSEVSRDARSILRQTEELAASETEVTRRWSATIDDLLRRGKVALWGAGAKGVTFANLLDGGRTRLDCVVDLNPQKQGHFIPGTGHPIVDFRQLQVRGVATAILMNPNYREENLALMNEAGTRVELI